MSDEAKMLSAAERAEIQQRADDYPAGCAEDKNSIADDRAALLAHLDALAAPADGEALGRELWAAVPVVTPVRWEDIEPWLRDRYRSHALKCHAIGHAAGALSREGEVAALREEVAISRREALSACNGMDAQQGEIARLAAELAEAERLMGAAIDNAAADRERALDAEAKLATARADGAREERRLCAKIADDETDSKAGQRIAERIRARGGR